MSDDNKIIKLADFSLDAFKELFKVHLDWVYIDLSIINMFIIVSNLMSKRHLEKSTEMNISVRLLFNHSCFRVFTTSNTAIFSPVHFKPIHQLLIVQDCYNKD